MNMKYVLNESAILHRMTREEAINVKGGDKPISPVDSLCTVTPTLRYCLKPILPVDSLCLKPIKPPFPFTGECLLAGCGGPPSQTDCHQCPASLDPGEM